MSYRRQWRRPRLWPSLALGLLALAGWVMWPLPAGFRTDTAPSGVTLLDRHGLPLRSARVVGGARQQWVSIADMDPDLLTAFVAAEDHRFYRHPGVDPLALGRALGSSVRSGRIVSGASTITMQLARLVHPSGRTFAGKLIQMAWALRLDRQLPKQVILERYLNLVPLGQSAVGVDAAARLFFGASARSLSLGEAATLAGLAGAPSRDNPLRSRARAAERRSVVLARMAASRVVSSAEVAAATAEPVLRTTGEARFEAPHFTSWVLSRLDSVPGVRTVPVRTSLDLPLQLAIESEVRHTVEVMRDKGAEHAAAVVLDNQSGDILAWVGSPDFSEPASGQVDMVISPRQPGSALKPFLYGLAFDRGYTPASVLPDLAAVYQTGTGPYAPRNYDRRFHGPTRIREALGSSFNVPAVELANRIGTPALLGTLRRAGFASLTHSADHYGLGLALGNGDVTLLELANGYRAIALGGVWHPVRWRASEAGEGPDASERVMSAGAALQLLDILADPIARIPGFGPSTPLEFPFPAAAKTGTSRHFTDNWAVATTAGFTVAVWVGNFSGRPMEGVSGVSGAGPLLQRAVLVTAARHPPGAWPTPGAHGLVAATVCRLSGLLATPRCPQATEWFRAGTAPESGCDWHTGEGVVLPVEYRAWAAQAREGNAVAAAGLVRVITGQAPQGFRIAYPQSGDRYRFVPGVELAYATIGLRSLGAPRRSTVRWFVDGHAYRGTRWSLVPGRHVIRAEAGHLADQVTIDVVSER
ncbi:MAG: penicillin-binding protein 1C [Gemmatimonadota bacterium]